jgi:hypothetical protein
MQPIRSARPALPLKALTPKRDPRIDYLVGVARELAMKAGYEAGEQLIDRFGAQRLYVPRLTRLSEKTKIFRALGSDAAKALADLYGGECIVVPLRSSLLRKRMTDYLLSTPRPSLNQVCAKFDVDRRTVARLRAQLRRQASRVAPAISPRNGVAAAPLVRLGSGGKLGGQKPP